MRLARGRRIFKVVLPPRREAQNQEISFSGFLKMAFPSRREAHFREIRSPILASFSAPFRVSFRGCFLKCFGRPLGTISVPLSSLVGSFGTSLRSLGGLWGSLGRLWACRGMLRRVFCVFAKWRSHRGKTLVSAVLGGPLGQSRRPWGVLGHTCAVFLHALGFYSGPCGDLWRSLGDGES